ncbi:hypothetical protein DPMN_105136 [Dreissena polymorpha]|uniref:Uncharacterized protein n=1 Tax=Dreissena polymorpha TaxID=45954 RepID=A0A9D4HB20_DREPO|nr:hypothetical protein DPMN_105122 [Dreissena polymorpha]KAH3831851.1 hypothetical protein DPMN_105123 [Dreissena polymorpha]KAH3831852.1 hypothetical protein DPMN_105124 [Dreissena polymorpha]KAH3831853.1 hypothetical protein DPMN_105125 [Dreissena polymorpha]KAH3831854.1 hypothetical protein DPMN_105126 [Dreissena polymorpha]
MAAWFICRHNQLQMLVSGFLLHHGSMVHLQTQSTADVSIRVPTPSWQHGSFADTINCRC